MLIAIGSDIVRRGLRQLLEDEESFAVIGEARDCETAIRLAETTRPDVALIGGDLLESVGIGIAKFQTPTVDAAVIVVTSTGDISLLAEWFAAGAIGFLAAETPRDRLYATVDAAARGESLLEAHDLQRLLDYMARTNRRALVSNSSSRPLTKRETEVLELAALGMSASKIGSQLGISERTARAHLSGCYQKLGVRSRTAAVAAALRNGLLRMPQ